MIFADKLIALRKQHGLSQEQLAEKLNVSRQSVSKWEGAQSIPDINKIIQLSQIFGVSTDYLLKDELENEKDEYIETGEKSEELKYVSMEDANEFLNITQSIATYIYLFAFWLQYRLLFLLFYQKQALCHFQKNRQQW